jgi:hypothetical protein
MPDPGAHLPGRGRYVCPRAECLARLARRTRAEGVNFTPAVDTAFRLALGLGLVENGAGEAHEN